MFGRYKVGQIYKHDDVKLFLSIIIKVGQVYQHDDVKLFFSVIIKVSSQKVIDPGTLYIRSNL